MFMLKCVVVVVVVSASLLLDLAWRHQTLLPVPCLPETQSALARTYTWTYTWRKIFLSEKSSVGKNRCVSIENNAPSVAHLPAL